MKRNSGMFIKEQTPWNKEKKGIYSKETLKKMSKARKGKINPMLGKHHSEETKRKIGIKSSQRKTPMFGRKHTKETRLKMSISKSNNKHPNWKGGITPLYYQIRNSFKSRQWRSDIFTRDNFTCQECGIHSGCGKTVVLEAHHIKQFAQIINENKIKILEEAEKCEELWDINNGITYCIDCHSKIDKHRGKFTK